jgi:Ca2+-binding EF-hand superfamily protein
MTMSRPNPFNAHRLTVLAASAGLVATVLVATATATAGDNRPEFPVSVTEARERAEARFQTLDADGSGEISSSELAAGEFPGRHGRHKFRHLLFSAPTDGDGAAFVGFAEGRAALDEGLFERLDVNGDELLSRDEFASDKVHEARRALLQEHMFQRLDRDGSGGISRAELPDRSQWLEAMDADDDGMVSREEAREHRRDMQRHRGPRGEGSVDTDDQG